MFNEPQLIGLTTSLDKDNQKPLEFLKQTSEKAKQLGKMSAFFTAKTFAAAGETYAAFGLVAMVYKPGLWLVAPVGLGAIIGLSDAVIDKLAEKNPENKTLQFMKSKSNAMNLGVTYFGDLGFTFNMLKTMGAIITQGQYIKYFRDIIFPGLAAASLIPAGAITRLRYKQSLGQDNATVLSGKIFSHVSATLRGAASTTGLMAPFQIQGILGPKLPTALIILTGLYGLTSSLIKDKHRNFSFYMTLCLQIICEHGSLAMTLFSLLNDVYAGVTQELYENGKIDISETGVDEQFFYSVMVLAVIEFIALGMMVPKTPPQDHIFEIIEASDDNQFVILEEGQELSVVNESSPLSINGDENDYESYLKMDNV